MLKSVNIIKDALEGTKPSSYLDYRLFLKALYVYGKTYSRGYTYQAFAEDLGFNATTVMHQVVNGYRPLSVKAAMQVVKRFDLDSSEAQYFLTLVVFCNANFA
ncbi:MAG: TIGR02147 family protein [Oligoflexus sp.]|nr:TIGR02147 family protein [Oligoflexus sp.]